MRSHAYMLRGILSLPFLWLTLVSWAQNPQWEWAMSMGTSAWEVAKQVAVDPATHHVYLVGDWEADLSATFPGGTNPSTQFNAPYRLMDGFVAKYDQDGNLLWPCTWRRTCSSWLRKRMRGVNFRELSRI